MTTANPSSANSDMDSSAGLVGRYLNISLQSDGAKKWLRVFKIILLTVYVKSKCSKQELQWTEGFSSTVEMDYLRTIK